MKYHLIIASYLKLVKSRIGAKVLDNHDVHDIEIIVRMKSHTMAKLHDQGCQVTWKTWKTWKSLENGKNKKLNLERP